MLDLAADVVLKGEGRTFEEYRATVLAENERAVSWLAEPGAGWEIAGSLRDKVGDDGRLLAFFGNTVTLPMTRRSISGCRRLQRALREALPEALAEPLDPATFHVTLHDLSAGRHPQGGEVEHEARCRERFARLARALERHDPMVALEPARVYPSVQVSLVIGLVPATDRDFRLLMNAYNLFEDIVDTPYWPRFHVTLDYFRPREVDPARVHDALPRHASVDPIHLDLRQLAYQTFTDMNHYQTEFTVSDMPHRE
jgi:hypothetical protein